jgi:hypothetical protein
MPYWFDVSSFVNDFVYSLQAFEFFFFAALMTVATVLYAVMAYFYKSAKPAYAGNEGYSDQHQLTASDELAAAAAAEKQSTEAAS